MENQKPSSGHQSPAVTPSHYNLRDSHRSIQFTAREELKFHEEALAAALARHQGIRKDAEKASQQAIQDLIQQRKILESEAALRAEIVRKEAAERAWNLEKQRQQEITAAQQAQDAAERQRQANIAAQAALNASRSSPPQPIAQPVPDPPRQSTAPPTFTQQTLPIQEIRPPIAEQEKPRIEQERPTAPATAPSFQPSISNVHVEAAVSKSPSRTYLGIPLPGTLPLELQDQYLDCIRILYSLKEHRKIFKDQVLPDPRFRQAKAQVGDDRRFIRKSVSQLTEDRRKNKEVMDKVMEKLSASLASPFPQVSLSQFLLGSPDGVPEISSYYIYLMNIFAKAIFSQFLVDASSNTKKADAIGMFASQLFATAQVQWRNQISFWPFLLAKFARRCPVLFGVYGNETTAEGKILLGWGKEDGKFVTNQRHAERMTGLGAGWASITLRDYNKSRLENPAPSWYFWRSAASIMNVPKNEVTNTHYLVLKALIEHNESRILKLFGNYGRMILRQAVVAYPDNTYTGDKVAAQGLRLLGDVWERDIHFRVK